MFSPNPTKAPELAAKIAMNNPPAWATFHHVLPMCKVAEKAGTISFMKAADLSANVTVDRASGTELTADDIVTGSVTYAIKRVEKRATIDKKEESNYGDEINLINAGGDQLAGTFFRGLEKMFVTYLTTAAPTATKAATGIVRAIQDKVDDVAVYGEPVIILTRKALRNLRDNEEVHEALVNFSRAASAIDYLQGKPDAFKIALADLLAVKAVIVADAICWGAAYDNEIFITAVQPAAMESTAVVNAVKAAPCAGAVFYTTPFNGEGADPFAPAEIQYWGDQKAKKNVFDAEAYIDFVCLDAKAVARINFAAEQQAG